MFKTTFFALAALSYVGGLHQAHSMEAADIAGPGVIFTAPVPFRPGTTYNMRIGTGHLHLSSVIRIMSSRDRADGTFDVGAKFV